MQLNDPITKIKGIGEKSAEAFYAAGIYTVNGLLHYFPRNYTTMPEAVPIREITKEGRKTIYGKIMSTPAMFSSRGKTILSFYVSDGTGRIKINLFNMPYMRKQIQPGRECYFSGACSLKGTEILMSQPKFLSKEQYEAECGFLAPVYPLRKDLTNTRLQKALKEVLYLCEDIHEYLPEDIRAGEDLLSIPEAIRQMHFPGSMEDVYAAIEKKLGLERIK